MTIIEEKVCRKCQSKKIIFVEYPLDHPEHYDGVSVIVCLNCGTHFGRWSEKELDIGEDEKRPGRRKKRVEKQDDSGPLEKTG
jgi:hypothetical protein